LRLIKIMMQELLIADDHPLFREALKGFISKYYPSTRIHEAERASDLYELVEAHPDADLLLLDLNMPDTVGFNALIYLRNEYPALPVAIISAHETPQLMRRALEHGAVGFIPKSSPQEELKTAIESILQGMPWAPAAAQEAPAISEEERNAANALRSLTPQQLRVLQMVCTGLLNKQIAYELDVSEATVKTHMTAILRKLGANNRTQAVLIANQLQLNPSELDFET